MAPKKPPAKSVEPPDGGGDKDADKDKAAAAAGEGGEKKPFLETPKGQLAVRIAAGVNFVLALVMFTLYVVLARRDALLFESIRMMRDFSIEYDPRYEVKTDLEVVALAQNLSDIMLQMTEKNEELQEEIDKLAKMLPEWTAYNKNLYYFSRDTSTWRDAIDRCIQRESLLVSVRWGEEQGFIDQESKRLKNEYWIGLYKNKSVTNGLIWLNKLAAQTVYWDAGYPIDKGECIYVAPKCIIKHCWRDDPCTTKRKFICKKSPRAIWYYH